MLLFKKRNATYLKTENLQYSSVVNELLASRGIDNIQDAEKFLNPSVNHIHSPFLFKDMDKLVELINIGIAQNKKFLIYGDYDCDGVCSIVILYKTLKSLNANVDYYIPNRAEGYGLNIAAINKLSKDYDFLITVDLGITNIEEVKLAKSLGMTVIITDHHQMPDVLPNADVIIHPAIKPYPFSGLCGAGVAYKVAAALLDKNDINELTQYAAIATVADIVPLIDENRIIVYEGVNSISKTQNYGLLALFEYIKTKQGENIKASQIAFQIAPRINATGRVEVANIAVELLLSNDVNKAKSFAENIEEMNTVRKQLENNMIEDALNQAKNIDLTKNKIIFVSGNNWHNGVIGLVAGKICELYNLPVVALSINQNTATGSIRSIPGINIYNFLKKCEKYFVKWGGHEQAAGLTIPVENIESFNKQINEYIIDEIEYKTFIPIKTYDLEIELDNANLNLAGELDKFAPTGFGNPSPLFLSNNLRVDSARKVGVDGNHLKLSLNNGKTSKDAIAFGFGTYYEKLPEFMDCIYSVSKNTFNGITNVSLEVKAIRPTLNSHINSINALSDEIFVNYYIKELSNTISKYNSLSNYIGDKIHNINEFKINDIYGTLFISLSKETAINAIENNYGIMDIYINGFNSTENYNSLVIMPEWDKIPKGYKTIVMLDDVISNEYISEILENYNCDKIVVVNSNEFKNIKDNILLSVDEYRTLYKLLLTKNYYDINSLSNNINCSLHQIAYGLKIFESLNFINYNQNPFQIQLIPNPQKCNIEESIFIKSLK